ncbi:hypothetical protein ACFQ3K_09965 [Brucella gallinifaecis]|uniref:Uncharacterized protein n=1 Tax=Brucella gallinifaecis TaxID=215590 RepID=A0A502BUK4_9HYPH|nr:hypothetical protein [Brucella gallinifaecis]TPF76886.1 hypothetical protein FHY56_00490 [Brucella gallinifaecis]
MNSKHLMNELNIFSAHAQKSFLFGQIWSANEKRLHLLNKLMGYLSIMRCDTKRVTSNLAASGMPEKVQGKGARQ